MIQLNPLYTYGLIKWGWDGSIYISMVHGLEISKLIQSLIIVFILSNNVNPEEIPSSTAFHLGLHCLSRYQYTKEVGELHVLVVRDAIENRK